MRAYVRNYLSCFNISLIRNFLHRVRKRKEELQLFETIVVFNYQITLLALLHYSVTFRFNCCVIYFCNNSWSQLFSKRISDAFFMYHYGRNDNSSAMCLRKFEYRVESHRCLDGTVHYFSWDKNKPYPYKVSLFSTAFYCDGRKHYLQCKPLKQRTFVI